MRQSSEDPVLEFFELSFFRATEQIEIELSFIIIIIVGDLSRNRIRTMLSCFQPPRLWGDMAHLGNEVSLHFIGDVGSVDCATAVRLRSGFPSESIDGAHRTREND